jgi:hypothetical protein
LENLDTEVDINRAWKTIRENIRISAKESLGYYELKKQKLWFDEDSHNYWTKGNKPTCSGYRIQAK